MSALKYIKDKLLEILIIFFSFLIVLLLLLIFQVNKIVVIMIISILSINYITMFIYNYLRKKSYYEKLKNKLDSLDKKYLITEIINECNFLDGKIFLEILSDINKNMHEEINYYKYNTLEFKEYIELWCHEIKTPVATTKLIIENNENKITKSILEEVDKIDDYIEQVLFYSRSENVDKDYIIKETSLNTVVNNVIKRNKKDLLSKNIKVEIDNNMSLVDSDYKWLEFIINQIVTNSIKYSKDNNSIIKVYSTNSKNNISLCIEDNGIGIESDEVNKVFDKGFTGSNGRKKYNSTGIGLYLCKKLCDKLNHNIIVKSTINKGTIITIVFPKNSYSNLTEM